MLYSFTSNFDSVMISTILYDNNPIDKKIHIRGNFFLQIDKTADSLRKVKTKLTDFRKALNILRHFTNIFI